jgi:outer membrane protein TolC
MNKPHSWRCLVFLAAVIFTLPVGEGLTAPSLDLPALIDEALARNPELHSLRQQLEGMGSRIVQATTLPDPTLGVTLWNFPQSFNVTQTQNAIFGITQKFPFPGKLGLKGEVAARGADITEQAVHTKERDVIAKVKLTYFELYLAHKDIELHDGQIALLKQLFEVANAKFGTGKGTQVDVLKAQVELSTLHQRLPVLQQRRETLEATLNTLLDRDPRSALGFPSEPAVSRLSVPLQELEKMAMGARPELKSAELAIRRGEQARELAERQYYPDFELSFQRFQNYQAPDGFGAVGLINVPFAFWAKPKYDAGLREAKAAVAAAQADYHAWQNLTRFQIKDLLAKMHAQQRVAELYRTTILPQAEQTFEAARAGYRTGRTAFSDVIEAERALLDYRLAYYRAIVDRENQVAALEQVVGTYFNQ